MKSKKISGSATIEDYKQVLIIADKLTIKGEKNFSKVFMKNRE